MSFFILKSDRGIIIARREEVLHGCCPIETHINLNRSTVVSSLHAARDIIREVRFDVHLKEMRNVFQKTMKKAQT